MERHLDGEIRALKQRLVAMAGLVEKQIERATDSLEQRDPTSLREVFELERKVNEAHKAVDEACLSTLALHQPLASDLRLIVAVIKINTDLERMGDQAVNIAHNTERYLRVEPLKPLIDLPRMAAETRSMVREAIDAFVRCDEKLSRDVLLRDDRVDALKSKIFSDVLGHIKDTPEKIEAGISLILVARNLERIGDHATNIAEDVIFAATGEDIRHAPRPETVQAALEGRS